VSKGISQQAISGALEDLQKRSKNERYYNNPVLWAEEVLDVQLWSRQKDVLMSLVHNKKTAVKSSHSTGKTYLSAIAACWWVSTRPNSMVRSTAPTYRQVHELLWEEIRKFHAEHKLVGRITQSDEWKRDLFGTEIQVGSGSKPADGDQHGFHGVHRPDGVLVILDEACHDDQTEVLTDTGWKMWADVTMDDLLLTMNPETRNTEYLKPSKLIAYEYSGDMALYEAKGANFMVTPNHEMLYKRPKKTELLRREMQDFPTLENCYMEKVVHWTGVTPTHFEVPALPGRRGQGTPITVDINDWATFLGWFASEGSINKGVNAVSIAQRKDRGRDEIRELLTKMPFNFFETDNGFGISSVQLAEHLIQFGRTCDVKRVPDYVRTWNPDLIERFVTAFRKGDGYIHRNQGILYTSCKDMADDLHELVLKMGLPSVIRERDLNPSYFAKEDRWITPTRNGWVVTVPPKKTDIRLRDTSLQVVHYDGMVYCATMPRNNTLFTRRKGYTLWSGNCGIDRNLYTAADAITTGEGDRVLAVGNPDDPATEFGDIFLHPKFDNETGEPIWNLMTISAFDTPNFTGEKVNPVAAKSLIQPKWVKQRESEWGAESSRYKAKILAEFPDQSNDAFFSQSAIDRSYATEIAPSNEYIVLGVDIAGHGDDDSVIYINRNGHIRYLASWSDGNIMVTSRKILDYALETGAHEVRIDGSGLGAAVVDALSEMDGFSKFLTVKVLGGNSPQDSNAHLNARAEQYDHLRKQMQLGKIDLDPDDKKVNDQLLAIKYMPTNRGALQIENKRDMRKRNVKSPDELDAVVYAAMDTSYMFAPQGTDVFREDAINLLDEEPFFTAFNW
jgi:hypothetical protein